MSTSRRKVLQHILLAAIGLGLPPDRLWNWVQGHGDRYRQALAASAAKRAILIGVNHYPSRPELGLRGCQMDVELQRELLLSRFGFKDSDIVVLCDSAATPTQIQDSLLQPFKADTESATTLVHFSGYGRIVQITLDKTDPRFQAYVTETDLSGSESINVLMPTILLTSPDHQSLIDWPVIDLCQYLNQLAPAATTLILDCGFTYSDPLIRGAIQLRAQPSTQPITDPSRPPELAWPTLSSGVLIAATGTYDLAAEVLWSGFSAGILSYLLTQYLWEMTPATTLYSTFHQITTRRELGVLPCQQPTVQTELDSCFLNQSPYLLPITQQAATGVVQEVLGNHSQVWLGGLPPAVLLGWQNGAVLSDLSHQTRLVIRSREGLLAQAYPLNPDESVLPVGTLLKEYSRVLSSNLRLAVGLDNDLGRIEKVDLTSALSRLGWADALNPRDQPVDCLICRITPALAQTLSNQGITATIDTYGLFWLGRELIQDSLGYSFEAATAAVYRLQPQLEHLLAVKRLRVLRNEGVSSLGVRFKIVIQRDNVETWTLQHQTVAAHSDLSAPALSDGLARLQEGDRLHFQITNDTEHDLFAFLLLVDGGGRLNSLWPYGTIASPLVLPKWDTTTIPPVDSLAEGWPGSDTFLCHPKGLTDMLLVVGINSMMTSFESLKSMMGDLSMQYPSPIPLVRPLDWVQTLIQELTQPGESDTRLLTHTEMACLSMSYFVI